MSKTPVCIYILAKPENMDFILKTIEESDSTNTYKFFSSSFECAKSLFNFEADLIFIDDTLFDTFQINIKKFYTKNSLFTFKRCVLFSFAKKLSDNRLLELSLFGIRSAVFGQKNFFKHVFNVINQVTQFQKSRPKISLCLSGGGLDGYMYSLGVCHGLEKCLENFKMHESDIFCGISSGSILASCFAGGVRTSELIQQAYKTHPALEPINLRVLFDFALKEIIKGIAKRKLPTGLFKGKKLQKFFAKQIQYFGIEDNLEALKKEIYIFATDQDTGEIVVFGKDPWKSSIKISQAVRASSALPPFYLPENIKGHWFTDGQLSSSIELDLPIHEKSSLVFVIDPIVAFSSTKSGEVKNRGGFFSSLQAIKNLVHSRSNLALQHARDKHPDVDFIKMQPTDELMDCMSGNPMRVPLQTRLIQMSAQATCNQIANQYEFYQHKFAKHGLTLKPQSEIQIE